MTVLFLATMVALSYSLLKSIIKHETRLAAKFAGVKAFEPDYDDMSEDSLCSIYYTCYKYPA